MDVGIMLYAGFRLLEASGPMDVFQEANRQCGRIVYEQHLVGPVPGPVVCSNGTAVGTTACLADAAASFDIVVIPGSPFDGPEREHRALVDWLHETGCHVRKLATVSNGAFLLARAGLADRRWLVTHPGGGQRLADEHSQVNVVAGQHCVKDGNVYSADGVHAGIRVALALVGEDLGQRVVEHIARRLLA
ncbi:DJ-1/PfpI family protein [Burkholderia sp. PR2]|uniref:DJ-1/PfpI family protein n=1 Tax=Burkholderia sp. PR2 TaxID=3448078 RepID=UPI000F5E1B23|nr:AraC family transcriptional regulator [Burkholderia sp. Bp9004]